MGFISELDLADFEDDESTHESRVGILIEVDYYLNFFLGKTFKKIGRFSGFFNSFKIGIEWTNYFGKFFFYQCLFSDLFY